MQLGFAEMWICFLLSSTLLSTVAGKRHVIYWGADSSKEYLDLKTGRVLNVQMGQFMDILCPQTSLIDVDGGLQQPIMFDLFNVTKPHFDQCSHEGRKNFIFSCNKPERENKLTIKFQRISPSPLGFRFQYCKDYYFVAIPRDQNKWGDGCHSNSSTRLHIKVACRGGANHHTTTKRIPSIAFDQSNPPRQGFPDPDLDTKDDPVIHPSIIPRLTSRKTTAKTPAGQPNILAQQGKKDPNSGLISKPTLSLMLMTLLFYVTLTTLT